MNFKQILPLEINFKLKHLFINKKFKLDKWKIQSEEKFVYFLDAPEYGNIGDQAIAYAMEKFMKDFFPDYIQREIQEDKIFDCLDQLKKIIKPNDVICLTGGGNMGVLYQKYEAIRRIIIKSFPDNLIIIFPSTIDYGDTKYGKKELEKAKKIYNSHSNLVCLAREEKSYNLMKKTFYNNFVIKCPDIVLYLDYRDIVKDRNNSIGICMRNDKEKEISDFDFKKVVKPGFETKLVSTVEKNVSHITENNRRKVVEDKLIEIASNKYFITDRLHGMIFAFITNTVCVALPNSNGKVEGVYSWIKGKGNVIFERKFNNSFCENFVVNNDLYDEFKNLADKISKIINNN